MQNRHQLENNQKLNNQHLHCYVNIKVNYFEVHFKIIKTPLKIMPGVPLTYLYTLIILQTRILLYVICALFVTKKKMSLKFSNEYLVCFLIAQVHKPTSVKIQKTSVRYYKRNINYVCFIREIFAAYRICRRK